MIHVTNIIGMERCAQSLEHLQEILKTLSPILILRKKRKKISAIVSYVASVKYRMRKNFLIIKVARNPAPRCVHVAKKSLTVRSLSSGDILPCLRRL
jgi:hypothetical protein